MKLCKYLLVIIVLFCLLCFTSCKGFPAQSDPEGNSMIYAVLSSPYSQSYFFTLNKDGTYIVEKGDGSLEDLMDDNIKQTTTSQTNLDNANYNEIIEIADNLGEFDGNENIVFDYWTASICYNQSTMYFTYGCSKNKNYDLLVTKLIELSPLDVVDPYGNIIEPAQLEHYM